MTEIFYQFSSVAKLSRFFYLHRAFACSRNGIIFFINWLADDHTVVIVTSSDGSTQVNMELKDLKDPAKSSIPVIRKGGKSDRIGKPIDVRITQTLPGNKAVNAASGNVIVNVILMWRKSQCRCLCTCNR